MRLRSQSSGVATLYSTVRIRPFCQTFQNCAHCNFGSKQVFLISTGSRTPQHVDESNFTGSNAGERRIEMIPLWPERSKVCFPDLNDFSRRHTGTFQA